MRNLGKTLFLSILILQSAWSAGVEATLSTNEVVNGNPVELQIEATGENITFPQIQAIEGVPVVGRSTANSLSFTSINGKNSTQKTITLTLQFIPQKDMTVPSYAVMIDGQTYSTKPIELKVVKSFAPKSQNNGQFSLQMRSSKEEVTVGESFVVTVYFSFADGVRLADNPRYQKPTFDGFFVKEITEPKRYRQDGQNVQELRYILTAKQEGNYTIDSAQANIPLPDKRRRDIFGMFMDAKWVPVASNTLSIKVDPLPKQADLVGDFNIESSIDTQEVKANKPVNLTINIDGEGSLEDFEIPDYAIDDVTVYGDDAKVQNHIVNDGLHSVYSKTFAFVGDHDFTIPSQEFTVYNPQTKEVKTLQIPSYQIKVESVPKPAAVTQTLQPSSFAASKQSDVMKKSSQNKIHQEEKYPFAWWMMGSAFMMGAGFMYLLMSLPWLKQFGQKRSVYDNDALQILYPHINESAQIEEMVRKLYAKKRGDKNVQIDKKQLKKMVEQYRHKK
ncbi:MAG: BatD family protein [Campylobacterales bacterium]|nr:BatD family protein [Campylobacterales bacterium]